MSEPVNTMGPGLGGEVAGGGQNSKGPTIGATIIVIILILGAIYVFWQRSTAKAPTTLTPTDSDMLSTTTTDPTNLDTGTGSNLEASTTPVQP